VLKKSKTTLTRRGQCKEKKLQRVPCAGVCALLLKLHLHGPLLDVSESEVYVYTIVSAGRYVVGRLPSSSPGWGTSGADPKDSATRAAVDLPWAAASLLDRPAPPPLRDYSMPRSCVSFAAWCGARSFKGFFNIIMSAS